MRFTYKTGSKGHRVYKKGRGGGGGNEAKANFTRKYNHHFAGGHAVRGKVRKSNIKSTIIFIQTGNYFSTEPSLSHFLPSGIGRV